MKTNRENSFNSWATKIIKILDFGKFEKDKRTQFILNIAVGLLIVFIMHGLENTKWGESRLNSAFDLFVILEANEAVNPTEDRRDILLLDIADIEENQKKNKEEGKTSFLSPRDIIADKMKMAFEGDADVIILDFSFEENDCCYPGRDEQLRKVLDENKNKRTKVIFPVRAGKDKRIPKLIFDDQIDSSPNYYRAIPTLLAFPEDAVVRYWKTFQQFKDDKILWSVPVLAVALHKGREKDLNNLESLVVQKDKKIDVFSLEIEPGKEEKTIRLPLDEDDPYLQRIRFRLIPKNCIAEYPAGNIPIIQNPTSIEFKDKIVIIGNSDPDMGDVLSTPVGDMAGMYIQANAVHTLLYGLQPRRTPWWVSILIDLLIIVSAAYLFHYMETFWKDLLVFIVGFFGLGAAGYFFFFKSFGIFPNFVFGIAAIGYIEVMSSLRDSLTRIKRPLRPGKTENKKVKRR